MGRQQTTKKVKVVGQETYINARTGELEEMTVISKEERDFNFHKVWMKSFLSTLEMVGSRKSRVAFWIVDNITRENMLPFTYRQIATKTETSIDTVTKTMNVLLETGFLKKLNQGCYLVNPDVVFKGTRAGRLNVLTKYRDAETYTQDQPTLQEQLDNVLASIQTLTAKAAQLTAQIQQLEGPQQEEIAS